MVWAVSILAVIVGGLVLLVLFEPGLNYHVEAPAVAPESEEFLCLIGALADAQVHRDSDVEVLTNGDVFYAAELAAVDAARRSVNLEAYIFRDDVIGRRFVEAMTRRAQAGVKVNVVVDAVGSVGTRDRTFAALRAAGGRVCWYQPLTSVASLKRLNNRTHRELLVIDGAVGFIGGAGIGDNWLTGIKGGPQWRDTVVRVTGDLVVGLQTAFCENWLESSEQVLTGAEYFPSCIESTTDDAGASPGEVAGLVVISAPSAGRATRARVLFQALLVSARKSIHITSPYFLPDRGVRRELCKAVARGVSVQVIAPGDHADHLLTRRASRRRYGELLAGGVQIAEYAPAMIHAKTLVVDGLWAVVGSTNFDNRSFGLNDEVNLAASSPTLAARLEDDFSRDLARSKPISLEEWRRRPLRERVVELLGRVIERHQ